MGYYLNMLGNDRENAAKGFRPNENYARELQQLFSIGLVKLNLDGTPIRDAQGKTSPTYNQATVEGYAQVFTGWNFAGNNTASDHEFYDPPKENWIDRGTRSGARRQPDLRQIARAGDPLHPSHARYQCEGRQRPHLGLVAR